MSRRWRPLLERLGLQPEPSHHHRQSSSESLPLYTTLSDSDSEPSTPSSSTTTLPTPPPSLSQPPTTTTKSKPTLARFLTDFTLGFADGLTVPFALTAGLSSLGHTDTVIYAGMAEICAGSISMGIGGYLAARGEVAAAAAEQAAVADEEGRDCGGDVDEKGCVVEDGDEGVDGVVARYLGPLELPFHLQAMVVQHVRGRAGVEEALVDLEREQLGKGGEEEGERLPSPVVAGLSVALGYLLGGMLPLFPYFLVSEVQDGLVWSFVTCAVALFVFGFGKDLALDVSRRRERSAREGSLGDEGRVKVRWRDVRRSSWEGAQMVILGSVAAAAAVLCVRAFEGFRTDQAAQTG